MLKISTNPKFVVIVTFICCAVVVNPVLAKFKWIQQDNLTATDTNSGDHFGFAVGVDGNTAVVGARYADPYSDDEGAVYVFDFNGLAWNQQQKLIASDAQANAFLGCAL